MSALKRLVTEESGQGLAEYGLILALIAIVVAVTLGPLGDTIGKIFGDVDSKLDGTTTP